LLDAFLNFVKCHCSCATSLIVSCNFRCESKVCDQKPEEKSGFKIVEDSSDGCCVVYRSVPVDCDVTECPYLAPTCKNFEELISYSIDECCFTYECKCNPSFCPTFGDPKCPDGSVRVVLDTDDCCPSGKCVLQNQESAAMSSASGISLANGLSSEMSGSDDAKAGQLFMPQASTVGSDALGAADSQALTNMQILPETSVCLDESGKEHSYGETWYKDGDPCNICSCYAENDAR